MVKHIISGRMLNIKYPKFLMDISPGVSSALSFDVDQAQVMSFHEP